MERVGKTKHLGEFFLCLINKKIGRYWPLCVLVPAYRSCCPGTGLQVLLSWYWPAGLAVLVLACRSCCPGTGPCVSWYRPADLAVLVLACRSCCPGTGLQVLLSIANPEDLLTLLLRSATTSSSMNLILDGKSFRCKICCMRSKY